MEKTANFDRIKYEFESNTIVPGLYTLHRPSQCNLKLPKDNRPIHKKINNAYEGKATVTLPQNGKLRKMIIPGNEKIIHPLILDQSEYEKTKQMGEFQSERLAIIKRIEEEARIKAIECEKRKKLLEEKFIPQPRNINDFIDNKNSNTAIKIIKRAEGMHDEEYQGARIANQIIMAAKCQAIRDEQVKEKALIAKKFEEEDKKLDMMMEEARLAALDKEQSKIAEQKLRRLQNIQDIKNQIANKEKSKFVDMERTQMEIVKNNQDTLVVELTEIQKLQKKRDDAMKLKELLDKANEEQRYIKQKQNEESRKLEERINAFKQQRHEREMRLKAEANEKHAAKSKHIDTIAMAQKREQQLRLMSEDLRNLKIQEDVEREYRANEKANALKKKNALLRLKEAQEKQIADIRRQIALEIARDEEILNNVLKQNEQEMIKEEMNNRSKQAAVKEFQKATMEQVNSKASRRLDVQKKKQSEDLVFLSELKAYDIKEKEVVKDKVQQIREQNIPDRYVKEVEQRLRKLKYY